MKKNVGSIDRAVRVLTAVALIALYFLNVVQGALGIVLLILAGTLLLTTVFSFCPLYAPFGLSTIRKKLQKG